MEKNDEKEYEKLDNIRIQGMIHAENKCRKLKMGAKKWSVTFQKARDTILYYKLSRSKKLGKSISSRYLMRLSKKLETQQF